MHLSVLHAPTHQWPPICGFANRAECIFCNDQLLDEHGKAKHFGCWFCWMMCPSHLKFTPNEATRMTFALNLGIHSSSSTHLALIYCNWGAKFIKLHANMIKTNFQILVTIPPRYNTERLHYCGANALYSSRAWENRKTKQKTFVQNQSHYTIPLTSNPHCSILSSGLSYHLYSPRIIHYKLSPLVSQEFYCAMRYWSMLR